MTATVDLETQAPPEADARSSCPGSGLPGGGVIHDARKRQRRQRWGAAALAALLIGLAIVWGSGGSGGSRHDSGRARPGQAAAASTRARGHRGCIAVSGSGSQASPPKSLLAILGVLRRPAGPADALPAGHGFSGVPLLRYVRRTRVIGDTSYYVYPALSGCRPGHVGLMNLAEPIDLGHGIMGGVGGGDITAAQIERAETAGTGPPGSDTSATITMIVPDGVASVTLRYPAGRASGYSAKISPPFTVTAPVIGNELVVSVPRSAGGGPIRNPTAMVWRGRHGHVLHVFHRL